MMRDYDCKVSTDAKRSLYTKVNTAVEHLTFVNLDLKTCPLSKILRILLGDYAYLSYSYPRQELVF